MIRKYSLLIMIFLVIFTPACQQSTLYDPSKTTQYTDFHTGSQGVFLRFLPETPPVRIYSNTPMDIMVEITNRGAWDIKNGRLYISGFDKQYIHPAFDSMPFLADGKSVFNPYGTITQTLTFSRGEPVTLPYNVDRTTQVIKATACYEYQTEASVEVCIDPKTTTTLRERTCVPQLSYSAGATGQGAPVAVTRVEQETYQGKIQFRIYFSNVGGGTVLRNTAINDCHILLNRQDANKLDVISVQYSGNTLNCKPFNPVPLDESGNGFIFCEGILPPNQIDTYKTVLQIKLNYGYRSSVQTNVDILKSP